MAKKRHYIANSGWFSTVLKVLFIIILILIILSIVRSCRECSYYAHITERTGYLPEKENWDNIPDVYPPYDENDTTNLPERVSLEYLFPPIGNQGQKGTCVVWAMGYNLKTALNARDKHLDSSQLAQPHYQTSPKDLWVSIPNGQRDPQCNGTAFEPAFQVLMSSGAASMEQAPYVGWRGCNGQGQGDPQNRIASFSHVVSQGQNPQAWQIKAYLADTIPLVICARLGDNFITWKDSSVIRSDTYNYSGMHAFHAMALVGYDDNRHAFRLRNSWGTEWGDNGSIWVDYNFFVNEMCLMVFMAENNH